MRLSREENRENYNYFLRQLTAKGLIDRDRSKEHWGNIPIHVMEIECLYDIYEEGMRLIDLGCGAGNIIRYASFIGYEVKGVEFDTRFEEHLLRYDVEFVDIRKLDLNILSEYDVVYSYKPLKEEFPKFIEGIKKHMKEGSHLITPEYSHK